MSDLFNESIRDGIFPDSLKIARIVPIHKQGSRSLVNNYRPISVLPFVAKIFEKLVCTRLNSFLAKANVFCRHQFGFRKGVSTSDAIVEFLDQVYGAINDSEIFVTVFLDFKKAFDTVDHLILLQKLCASGIRGTPYNWFRSYLSNRPQYVTINGEKSAQTYMNMGVPQGSVLGPVLFLIYINDMFKSVSRVQLVHFADDATAFFSDKDLATLVKIINDELELIDGWLISNRLSLNVEKTIFMIMGQSNVTFPLAIRNCSIKQVTSAKFLGVIVDDKLCFREHITNVTVKLSQFCGVLWKMKHCVPSRVLKLLYMSLVYPHLNYGLAAWGSSSNTILNKIIAKQNKIIEVIFGNCSENILKSHRVLSFGNLYKYTLLIKLFRDLKGRTFVYCKTKIDEFQPSHSYETRFKSNEGLIPPRFTKTKCMRSFLYRSICFWNSIPTEIKTENHLKSVKRKLKIYLLG